MPGVTPSGRPRKRDFKDKKEYEKRKKKWDAEYELWKDVSCPCRYGYFDEDGIWISGGSVRAWISSDGKEGKQPNPRWKDNKGRAPEVNEDAKETRLLSPKEVMAKLSEREVQQDPE
jgi:hypothetical protein